MLWGRDAPEAALTQLKTIAAQPYVVEHVAAMPDLHVANGVAVGTVFATLDTVVPVALGGDLGCGMSAVRFDFPAARLSPRDLQHLLDSLGRCIPVGDATHRGQGVPLPEALASPPLSTATLARLWAHAGPRHLGTLGGGNHFLELDRDGGGDLWLLVHSGSRGLGAAIAQHHLRVAQELGQGELPGLRIEVPEGRACLSDLGWALSFAKANRAHLLARAAELIAGLIGQPADGAPIDGHHNFVSEELHLGRRLLVHRKGAIAAPRGQLALIPGSMGTASYVVEGLGEPAAFASASHGAGRVLTRRQARERLDAPRFLASMGRVTFDRSRLRALVEEAPAAYRDIHQVLDDEAELVRPVKRLEPLAVLKG
jgi:tRNA-splicing ligase RtcB